MAIRSATISSAAGSTGEEDGPRARRGRARSARPPPSPPCPRARARAIDPRLHSVAAEREREDRQVLAGDDLHRAHRRGEERLQRSALLLAGRQVERGVEAGGRHQDQQQVGQERGGEARATARGVGRGPPRLTSSGLAPPRRPVRGPSSAGGGAPRRGRSGRARPALHRIRVHVRRVGEHPDGDARARTLRGA